MRRLLPRLQLGSAPGQAQLQLSSAPSSSSAPAQLHLCSAPAQLQLGSAPAPAQLQISSAPAPARLQLQSSAAPAQLSPSAAQLQLNSNSSSAPAPAPPQLRSSPGSSSAPAQLVVGKLCSIGGGPMALWHWRWTGFQADPLQNQCHSTKKNARSRITCDDGGKPHSPEISLPCPQFCLRPPRHPQITAATALISPYDVRSLGRGQGNSLK